MADKMQQKNYNIFSYKYLANKCLKIQNAKVLKVAGTTKRVNVKNKKIALVL